jgi:outer membrane immunogenic protein
MKKFLLGSVGLAAMLAGPAMAADMRLPPPPPPVAYYDWTGVYVGFGVGGVWETVNRTYPNIVAPSNFSSNDSDGILDVHAGAQWQWGAWVLGVEAALSGGFREMRSNVGLPNPPFSGAAPANLTAVNKITNLFTVGPRLGYAWDRLMIFGTGGWASANIKGQYENANTAVEFNPAFSGQSRNNGWYAGGGFEYMVHKGPLVDVILGAEYQHFDVRSNRAFTDNTVIGSPNTFDQDAKGDIVRARLTIKTQGYGYFWR